MGVRWEPFSIPLAKGLDTGSDPRSLQQPLLAKCYNAVFDEEGGIQKRHPYSTRTPNISPTGTLSDVRKYFSFDGEELCFTKDKLWSWSGAHSKWFQKATYFAPTVAEEEVFASEAEQYNCDRVTVAGITIYTWEQKATVTTIWVAGVDATTGTTVYPAQELPSNGYSRPRLARLVSTALLFAYDSATGDINIFTLNPASPPSSWVSGALATPAISVNADGNYDVTSNGATTCVLVSRNTFTGTYQIVEMNSSGTIVTDIVKAFVATGRVAIAESDDGLNVVVAYEDNTGPPTAMQCDLLLRSGLTNVIGAVNITIDGAITAINAQLTCQFKKTADAGEFRCYVFWQVSTSVVGPQFSPLNMNWFDTAGNFGTTTSLIRGLFPVAQPIADADGNMFLWAVFEGSSGVSGAGVTVASGYRLSAQNTYFLVSIDGTIVAKAVPQLAGGMPLSTGYISGMDYVSANTYAFAGIKRAIVPTGGSVADRMYRVGIKKGHPRVGIKFTSRSAYSKRSPVDIVLRMDDDEARRTVKVGKTIYVSGAQVMQYDGEGLVEVGFPVAPWYLNSGTTAAGNILAGTYATTPTLSYTNAVGETEQSTAAVTALKTLASSLSNDHFIGSVYATNKDNVAVTVYRSLANPGVDSPRYKTTSQDPATLAGANKYIVNDKTSSTGYSPTAGWTDDMPDATLNSKQTFYENGANLERIAPPGARIIAQGQDRVFLAGIPGLPNTVYYSHTRAPGEIAAFHGTLYFDVPADNGDITGLSFMNETLVVFCERGIYAVPGTGYTNAGNGENYGPARMISTDVGCVRAELIETTPDGLFFYSSKGWYQLQRNWQLSYVGGPIEKFNTDTFKSVHLLADQHQIRLLSTQRCLVFDYTVKEWSEWTISDGLDAAKVNGVWQYMNASGGVNIEQADYTGVDYSLDVETAWLKFDGLQGYTRMRWFYILGEYRSACAIRIRVARNYLEDDTLGPTWMQDEQRVVSPTLVGGPLQQRKRLKYQKGQSYKIRINDQGVVADSNPTGESFRLTGLTFSVGMKPNSYKNLPLAQK